MTLYKVVSPNVKTGEPQKRVPMTAEEEAQFLKDLEVPEAVKWSDIRAKRDGLLKNSDWTQVVDNTEFLTAEKQKEWQDYRKALRRLPQNYINADDVVWPEEPRK